MNLKERFVKICHFYKFSFMYLNELSLGRSNPSLVSLGLVYTIHFIIKLISIILHF